WGETGVLIDMAVCDLCHVRKRSLFRGLILFVVVALLSAVPAPAFAQLKSSLQKRVLALHLMNRDATSSLARDRVYQKVFKDGLDGQIDYYSESLELPRFGGNDYQRAFRDFLKQKYKGTKFDLIVTSGDLRDFLVRYGRELFPDTPVVFSFSDDNGGALP